jgi:hypothetical protein
MKNGSIKKEDSERKEEGKSLRMCGIIRHIFFKRDILSSS